jgi:hypothetical protein
MAERELLLSPQDDGDAVELSSRVYRKRILPLATINYRGRKISFDAQYLTDLAQSFNSGAYDQVAFMLADTNNAHTLDPERFRGEVQGVEVGDDGLYATIQVTPEAAKVLEQNPKLGVSARILENYERSDGKQFPRALQHVLGTLDPVIPGLGSWEEVALSNGIDPGNVIDLSEHSYEELEPVATRQEHLQQVAAATDMTVEDLEALGMTDDELAIFASAFVEDAPAAEIAADTGDDELIEEPGEQAGLLDVSDDTDELPSEAEIEAAVEALSDEELTALAAELGIPADEELETGEEEATAEATAEAEAETEAIAEETVETPAEPTDAELAERLGTGEFGSGLEDPIAADPDLSDLSDEDLAKMTEMWETAHNLDEAAATEEAAAVAAEAAESSATAEETAGTVAEATEVPQLVGAGSVSLSNEAGPEVVALSNQVATLQQQLAIQGFDALKREYVRQGVPSALVDLARPILVAGQALEFSNSTGDRVDPAAIVKQLLDSATGYIDLARERGHSYSPEAEDKAAMQAEDDKRLASLWGEQYGN